MAKDRPPQRVPLRVPENWKGQDRAMIVQLERVLDDVYRRLGSLDRRVTTLEGEEADGGSND